VRYVKIGSTRSVYVFLMMRTYFLVKMEFTSWYCDNCNKGVAKLFQSVVKLQARQDKLENRVDSVVEEVKGMREDLNRVENKISEMYELEKIKEVVDEQLQGVDSKLVSVNSALDKVRSKALEEKDKENRACNIIMYNVNESVKPSKEDRWKDDKKLCLDLFNKVLGVPIREEDMKRFLRLGKADDASRTRPVLIQFRDRILKNMIMESLSKLKDADDVFKKIIFAHDMTRTERQECKELVEEAKKKQLEDTSGEFIYRVRGTPGNLRIDRIRKRH